MKKRAETSIIQRNRDVEHIMLASCQYGCHGFGKENFKKNFCMLVAADIHGCQKQLASAIEYLNNYPALDCGICLGDIQPADFSSDNSWYIEEVKKAQKEFFTLLGNHDLGNSKKAALSATSQMAFEKFILPLKAQMGLTEVHTPYYVKFFKQYKIALLVLNNYDQPDYLDEEGNYRISRGVAVFSQTQIDWLIAELNKIPKDYHLLIAMHAFPYATSVTPCAWSQEGEVLHGEAENGYNDDLLLDIMWAWKNGAEMQETYRFGEGGLLPRLKVDCNFTKRGKGNFIGYIVGHFHKDVLATAKKYVDQKVIVFPSSALDLWQNYNSDLPRTEGTKAEDLLTTLSVDTEKRQIRLVRIGSNFTSTMTERTYTVISY